MNTKTVLKLVLILVTVLMANIAIADTYSQIQYIAPQTTNARQLSIYINEAARDYRVPADLLTAILAKESMFHLDAVNYRTHDYGIGQLNIKTIKALKLNKTLILTDLRYSVRASAMVLAWFRRYSARESNWFCRYNVGTAKFTIQNIVSCEKYVAGVQSYQFETLIAKEY